MTYLPTVNYNFPVAKYNLPGITEDSTYQDLFDQFLTEFGVKAEIDPTSGSTTFRFDQNAATTSYYHRVNNWISAYNTIATTDPDQTQSDIQNGILAFYKEVDDQYVRDDEFITANYNGYKAFMFYFQEASRQVRKAQDAISQVLDIINSMTSLQSPAAIWSSMNSLGLLKKQLDDSLGNLGGYMAEDGSGKLILDNYEEKIDFGVDTLEDLRLLIKGNTKFANISILDKLKFIGSYYAIGKSTCSSLVFPASSEGVPCIPNPAYTSATQQKTILGGFEDFYTAFLIDRDGPINALSSILEIKVDALRATLSLQAEQVKALNEYTLFVNKGIDQLNNSQKLGYVTSTDTNVDGNAKNAFPASAFNIFSTICCGSPAREFFKYNGKNYLIVQYDNTASMYGTAPNQITYNKSKTFTGCYMLVEATSDGFTAFCEMYKNLGASDKPDTENYEALIQKFQTLGGPSGSTEYVNPSTAVIDGKEQSYITIDGKQNYFNDNGYCVIDDFATTQGKAKDKIKHIVFKSAESEVNNLPREFGVSTLGRAVVAYGTGSAEEGYSPNVKWYGYGKPWEDKHEIRSASGALKAWTDAFGRYSGYIDTKIQETNTDINAARQKIDTFDTTSSTFRKKAHDTYSGIVSKI